MTSDRSGATPAAAARVVLVALGLIALALFAWAGRTVLFALFLGALLAVLLSFLTSLLVRVGLPRVPALLVVLLAGFGTVAAFGLLVWPILRDQLVTVGSQVPAAVEQVSDWFESQYDFLVGRVGEPAPELEERVRSRVSDQVGRVLSGAVPVIQTTMGAVAGILMVFALGVYLTLDPGLYRAGLERLIPPRNRARVGRALDAAHHTLQRWLLGTFINMVLVGLLVGVGLWMLDVPAAFALAAIAGVLEFIPFVGPFLAAVPALALALTVDPMTVLWVAVLYLVVQQIESNLLTPLVMQGAVRLPPALTLFFQALMVLVFGALGLLLAVPLLAVSMVMTQILYVEPLEAPVGGQPPNVDQGTDAPSGGPLHAGRKGAPPARSAGADTEVLEPP